MSGSHGGYVGIDLAWKATNRSGLAVVDDEGRLVASGAVKSDDEIDAWLSTYAPDLIAVAVDAPLVVPNETGQRVAEKLIGQAYGRYGASAYPANRSNPLFDPPRAETIAQRFGWSVDPNTQVGSGTTVCIEVYPHPALVGLFELPQRVLYKKGSSRQSGFLELAACLQSVPELRLGESGRWAELLEIIANPRPGDLNRIEDEIDAILCAHLAWLWHRNPGALEVYGSVEEGYIVAPPPPIHAASISPARKSQPPKELVEVWGVKPGPSGTSLGASWVDAIHGETEGRQVFAPGARLMLEVEFALPVPADSQDQWDLDTLLKPTIDALIALMGVRQGDTRTPQADDERIDKIVASKRNAAPGERLGARIQLSVLRTPPQPGRQADSGS